MTTRLLKHKQEMRFKRMPKPTSIEIIDLLKRDISQEAIVRMGYPESTVRYYHRKMHKPRTFKRMVKQISRYNKKRAKGNK